MCIHKLYISCIRKIYKGITKANKSDIKTLKAK